MMTSRQNTGGAAGGERRAAAAQRVGAACVVTFWSLVYFVRAAHGALVKTKGLPDDCILRKGSLCLTFLFGFL